MKSVIFIFKTFFLLKRVLWRNDHPDSIKFCRFTDIVGNDKVSVVDWIERTKEEADSHAVYFIFLMGFLVRVREDDRSYEYLGTLALYG